MRNTKIELTSIAPIAVGILCLTFLSVGAERPQKGQSPADKPSAKGPLLVLKKKQPDSPLRITDIIVADSEDPRMPTVYLNKSDKLILVYAVKHEAPSNQGAISVSTVSINPDRERSLGPGQSAQLEIDTTDFNEPLEKLVLSVDFVEFADGTRWGLDTMKNAERVDGVRAGAKAERDALMRVLKAEGADGVARSLDSVAPEPDLASSRSKEWLNSFSDGVNWMRERVRRKGRNYSEIEKELRRLLDFSEERR